MDLLPEHDSRPVQQHRSSCQFNIIAQNAGERSIRLSRRRGFSHGRWSVPQLCCMDKIQPSFGLGSFITQAIRTRVGAWIYRRLLPDLYSRDTCAEALNQRAWMDDEAA